MTSSKIQTIIENTSCLDNLIVVENNFLQVLDVIKNTYEFDTLTNITAERNDKTLELIYDLYSKENNEFIKILIHAKDNTESITKFYPNAIEYQDKISENFSILFT